MLKEISKMKSENWGGLASMTGSLIALAAGDAEGVISTASFVASEISFARKGHISDGYSLGCAGISFGDGLLCFSDATSGNPALQITMAALTGIWAIGAARYPIERAGRFVVKYSERLGSRLQRTADAIPPLVGSTNLMFRAPTVYTAALTGEHFNTVIFACNMFWGTADVLLGRLQVFVKGPVKAFAQGGDNLTGNCVSKYVIRPANWIIKFIWQPKTYSKPEG